MTFLNQQNETYFINKTKIRIGDTLLRIITRVRLFAVFTPEIRIFGL